VQLGVRSSESIGLDSHHVHRPLRPEHVLNIRVRAFLSETDTLRHTIRTLARLVRELIRPNAHSAFTRRGSFAGFDQNCIRLSVRETFHFYGRPLAARGSRECQRHPALAKDLRKTRFADDTPRDDSGIPFRKSLARPKASSLKNGYFHPNTRQSSSFP